jgi:hypothetical protein
MKNKTRGNNFFFLVQIFVAGNHEMTLRKHSAGKIQSLLPHVTYLQDSSVTVDGLVVYGSPWTFERVTPATAFTKPRAALGSKCWNLIPDNVDILVTHSPPKGILDYDGHCGCEDLREQIFNRIRYDLLTVFFLSVPAWDSTILLPWETYACHSS